MALRSGIPAREWRTELRDAFTALELYRQEDDRQAREAEKMRRRR